jgi:phosphoserine aminotransferase
VTTSEIPAIKIPRGLQPADGRFGCGPSKVRPESLAELAAVSTTYLGTSHRQPTVKRVVGSLRTGLTALFGLPDGWEILLGNGGATYFWDAATFGLITTRSQHLSFGEFSSKFAAAAKAAPHLEAPVVIASDPGTHPRAVADASVDVYALTHNETSTGVAMQLSRPAADGLVLVDATSGAGGLVWDPAQVDVYYFSPQKCFAGDGGLWVAACSPAAIARIQEISAAGRWAPASLDLKIALDNSLQNQTYNTPGLATIFLLDLQVQWMLEHGGLAWAAGRSAQSAATLYGWAESRSFASPYVVNPAERSNVVGTIDLEGVDAGVVSKVLRANGIVDTEAYRKLGRNQLRIGMFPAIAPDDVAALTTCVDYVVEALGAQAA